MQNKAIILSLFVCLIFSTISAQNYKDPKLPIESRINSLLKEMTLDEKVGQLVMPILEDANAALEQDVALGKAGTITAIRFAEFSAKTRNRIQKIAVEQTRLGIPLVFCFDVIHGYKTIFPTPLALSASWDTELVKKTAEVAAREASVTGIDITFSPMVDVARDARWGRISEGSGEDVLLNSLFAKAMVEGYQGDNLQSKYSVGACLKHFVGYGAAVGGRDYQFTELSERALRETYLPPFKAGIDAGAVSVMSAFNDISGVPAAANSFTLTQVLRNEWLFNGFVVSDWEAVDELKKHGVAQTDEEAAIAALSAGTDIEMRSKCYQSLIKGVKEKRFSEKIIDEAVRRVLRVKFMLGLFESPYTVEGEEKVEFLAKSHRELARKAAAESMVLLKNDNSLPLKEKGEITVLGEFANNRDVLGWWTGNGDRKDVVTVIDGLQANCPPNLKITHAATPQSINTKTVIVCVGESGNMFGEDHGRTDLALPWGQTEMIKQLKEAGHKVIVVVFNGRPLVLTEVEKYADAILLAWHPGTETGNALADVLLGNVNPSGKLTVTFPKKTGQIPIFYSERTSGRPDKDRYIDLDTNPLYPFGYGMSYTKFEYNNLRVSKSTISKNETVNVMVDISNKGRVNGKEIVQLYIRDKVASITQPRKKLIDFKKIEIHPGENRTVTFELKAEQLMILDKNMNQILEPGEFDLFVGRNSSDVLTQIVTAK
jgi:beta-glucosidase